MGIAREVAKHRGAAAENKLRLPRQAPLGPAELPRGNPFEHRLRRQAARALRMILQGPERSCGRTALAAKESREETLNPRKQQLWVEYVSWGGISERCGSLGKRGPGCLHPALAPERWLNPKPYPLNPKP